MASAVARARYLRIAPRKLRLVADMIRNRRVDDARDILAYAVKGGSPLLGKVLEAAVANAESAATERNERVDTDEMTVRVVKVDEGPMLRRFQPRARGRATRLRKRMSHVEIVISDEQVS